MIEIAWLRSKVQEGQYFFSRHADQERQNDNLTVVEVEEALLKGMILERYDDTGRGASCLAVGFTDAGKPIHVVVGRRGDYLAIVTAYIPAPPKFKSPYERG
jgi:hypothetical protein